MKRTKFAHLTQSAILLVMLSIPSASSARDVTFKWEANPEPLTGYKLYFKSGSDTSPPYDGTSINGHDFPMLIAKVTTCTVTGLTDTATYQFVLTAYNEEEESGFSDVVTVAPVSSPTILFMKQN